MMLIFDCCVAISFESKCSLLERVMGLTKLFGGAVDKSTRAGDATDVCVSTLT